MDGCDSLEIWSSFVQAKYLKEAMTYTGRCPACRSPKDCNNYFCVHCKVGGLCPVAFRAGGEHHRHRWLQVRRQSLHNAVDPKELAEFIGAESMKHIQQCVLNGGTLCYLNRSKAPELNGSSTRRSHASGSSSKRARTEPVSKLKACRGCSRWISNLQNSVEEFMVCDLQCLITVARREPGKNLLHLRDAALSLTDVHPQTALEKINPKSGAPVRASTSKVLAVVHAPGCSGASGGSGSSSGKPHGSIPNRAAAAAHNPAPLIIRESELAMAPRDWRSPCTEQRSARRIQDGGEPGLPRGDQPDGRSHRWQPRMIVDLPASSSAAIDVPSEPAAGLREEDLRRGESGNTSPGDSRGSSGAQPPAAARGFQAPDYSTLPLGHRSEGLHKIIQVTQRNSDWDRLLGESGRTSRP